MLLEYRIWQGVLWQLRPRSYSIHQCTEVCKLDCMILMRKHKLEGPICRIGLLVLLRIFLAAASYLRHRRNGWESIRSTYARELKPSVGALLEGMFFEGKARQERWLL